MSNRAAKRLAKAGYSRIPIYARKDKNYILGVLLIKSLIGLDFNENKEVSLEDLVHDDLVTLRKPMFIKPDVEMGTLLQKFKNGRSHMAIVTEDPEAMEEQVKRLYRDDSLIIDDDENTESNKSGPSAQRPAVIGLVTIEDILEAIINDEIYDEDDYDNHHQQNLVKLDYSYEHSHNASNIHEEADHVIDDMKVIYEERMKKNVLKMLEDKITKRGES